MRKHRKAIRAELAPLRIALVGDSTVASYPTPPGDRPSLTGWGQVFDEFLSDRVTVLNHAVSGHSSKSFIREGLWQKTLTDRDADATVTLHSGQLHWKGISQVWDAVSRRSLAPTTEPFASVLAPGSIEPCG